MGGIPRVELSCLENIPGPAETLKIERRLESSTKLVKYSGKPVIEGEDLNKHIAISSDPANIPAVEYTGSEVFSNSSNKAVREAIKSHNWLNLGNHPNQSSRKHGQVGTCAQAH